MFPCRAGARSRGDQRVHLNPVSDRWERTSPQPAACQRGIFYNICTTTRHRRPGVPARLWRGDDARDRALVGVDAASIPIVSVRDPWRDGPDEFHEKYPDAAQGGLRNNAYTNVLVAAVRHRRPAAGAAAREPRAEVRERLGIGDDELAVWQT